MGSTLLQKPNSGTTFFNPLIIIPKKDSIEIVLDDGHPNSNTDQTSYWCSLELLATQLARANKKTVNLQVILFTHMHVLH